MSTEKTLDKLLSLINTSGSQKGLMSLSILSEFCPTSPREGFEHLPSAIREEEEILSVVLQGGDSGRNQVSMGQTSDHPDAEFNFSVCSLTERNDAWTQCESASANDKERLLMELQVLEIQRKKLELQNLLEENKQVERQQHATLRSIQIAQQQIQQSTVDLQEKHREVGQLALLRAQLQEDRSELELLKERVEYDRECLEREKQQLATEREEWERKVEDFVEQTKKDSEEVKEVRQQLERYHLDQRILLQREMSLEESLEQFRLEQTAFSQEVHSFRQEQALRQQEKREFLQAQQQLSLEKQDIELSRLQLKAQTENLKQMIKSVEMRMRHDLERRSSEKSPPPFEHHRRRSELLQSVLTGATRLSRFDERHKQSQKREFLSCLKRRNMKAKVLERLSALVVYRISAALSNIRKCPAKQSLRSPLVKKSLILKRHTRVDSNTQLQCDHFRSQNVPLNELDSPYPKSTTAAKNVIRLHQQMKLPLGDRTQNYQHQQNSLRGVQREHRASASLLYEQEANRLDTAFRKVDVFAENEYCLTAREGFEQKPTRTMRSETQAPPQTARERSTTTTQKRLKISRNHQV